MTEQREHWGSSLGFIMAAAGSAIGLGTMWKLPYTMGQNGGGAFILLFLLFNLVVGIPLFIGELVLGRQSQRGAVGAFLHFSKKDSSWNTVGWLSIICSYLILGWYCVVAGWGLQYILMTLVDAFSGLDKAQVDAAFDAFRSSGDLNILWQIVFLALCASIVKKGLSSGIEYWSKLCTSGLFIALIGLLAYASTLSGFGEGLRYILVPDWSQINATSVLKALGLALFTLSLGFGTMVTYGSYLSKSDNIPKTALIVGVANFFTSILIALMIYPMIFTFGFKPESGEGLIFKALPFVFEQLPGSMLISLAFFVLLIFAALTSAVSILEACVANLVDLKKWSRPKALAVSCGIIFLLGLPTALSESHFIFDKWEAVFQASYFETTNVLVDWLLAIVALFTSLFIGFFMDQNAVKLGFLNGKKENFAFKTWIFSLRFIIPIGIILIVMNKAGLFRI